MAIQKLEYTTAYGNKLKLSGAPNSMGVELLFLSCNAEEREQLLECLAENHAEQLERET